MPTYNIDGPAPVRVWRDQDGNIEYATLDRAFNFYSPLTTSATYTPPRWSDYDIELEGDHFVMKPKVEAAESYLK